MQSEEIIIADSSPLIGLARIGHLELLRKVARRIIVPEAVWEEATAARIEAPGAREIRAACNWIEIAVAENARVQLLLADVDLGEAEALVLAQVNPGSMLLIDDLGARRVADRLGLRRMGTLAVLARAKKNGHIQAVKPLAEALIANGLFIKDEIVRAVLIEVGEA